MLDVRMLWRSTGVRSLRSRGRCTTHAVERRLAATLGEHHVDRVVVRPGDPPQVGGRAVRGHRTRPGRQHGGGDPLLTRVGAADESGDPGMQRLERTARRARGTTPVRDMPRRSAACLVTSPWCSAAYSSSAGRSTPALGVAATGKGKADDLGGIRPGFRDGSRPGYGSRPDGGRVSVAGVVVGDEGVGLGGGGGERGSDVGAAEDRRHGAGGDRARPRAAGRAPVRPRPGRRRRRRAGRRRPGTGDRWRTSCCSGSSSRASSRIGTYPVAAAHVDCALGARRGT